MIIKFKPKSKGKSTKEQLDELTVMIGEALNKIDRGYKVEPTPGSLSDLVDKLFEENRK